MGRRKGFGKIKKVKVPNFELIDHEARPKLEPYRLMDEVRKSAHQDTKDAKILLAFRKNWKSDVDGHILLGKCIKASELQRELVDWDYVILLNFEVWHSQEFTKEKKTALLDHELCFPAEVSVTGPEVELGIRRWYSGEMVEITTAAGHKLSGTPNHPVLTDKGWVPLGLLNEGRYVVSSRSPERVSAAMDPHKYQVPSSIEDVMRSVPVVSGLMPQSAHDLDANFPNGEVDIVFANRDLLLAFVSSIAKHLHKVQLGWRRAIDMSVASLGHFDQGFGRMLLSSPGIPSEFEAGYPFVRTEFSHSVSLGVGGVSDGNASIDEEPFKGTHVTPEGLLQCMQRCASGVGFDQIVKRRSFQYDSHVFNLQTSQQWYHANGVVVHNCHTGQQLDREGEQKVDAKGRKVWRICAHEIEEFVGVIQRNGCYKRDLQLFAETIMKQAQKTIPFPEAATGTNGEVVVQ